MRRQFCVAVPDCCIRLNLCQEKTVGQVGSANIGIPEIGSDHIRIREIRLPQIRGDKISASEIGAREVGALQLRSHQIGILVIPPFFVFLMSFPDKGTRLGQ